MANFYQTLFKFQLLKTMRRIFIRFILLSISVFFLAAPAFAADYKTDYVVEYFVKDEGQNITVHTKFTITETNQRSDIVIKKLSLVFPKGFTIRNIASTDKGGNVAVETTSDELTTTLGLPLNNPQVGKGLQNIVNVDFDQDNLFQVNGNVWEVLLPTINDPEVQNYKIIVHLPESTNKKISIAKPVPTTIHGKDIIWENPHTRTVQAVFGDKQYYALKLDYHLRNSKDSAVYTDIAFPPDTQYQKVYVTSIVPSPADAQLDDDGNYLGRYTLRGHEALDISFTGVVEVSSTPYTSMKQYTTDRFQAQKGYLLADPPLWHVDNIGLLPSAKTPNEIHSWLVHNFSYNFERLNAPSSRMGAEQALMQPTKVVCTEYSDTFIASARERGVYSREIQGFGYSRDQFFRPLSLASDILHSWPEYYDEVSGVWHQIDPTWESTSGIDYFSSLDLNHIAFVIHGRAPDYPYPAGAYKVANSKDVNVSVTDGRPEEKISLVLQSAKVPTAIIAGNLYEIQ
ncbi:hypothetical protein HGB07_01535, partial [Candidatus Roizmanbacteria bacterium]|nr:hypothetical protein [Candidatus Roizmanbacteria bacterium]